MPRERTLATAFRLLDRGVFRIGGEHYTEENGSFGEDINAYLKQVISPEASAKDFRTWHATVLTAVTLADRPRPRTETAARREVSRAMKQVSEYMGNTPAVCRASYVDPRVIDRFLDGVQLPAARRKPVSTGTQGGALELPPPSPSVERAVLRLLESS